MVKAPHSPYPYDRNGSIADRVFKQVDNMDKYFSVSQYPENCNYSAGHRNAYKVLQASSVTVPSKKGLDIALSLSAIQFSLRDRALKIVQSSSQRLRRYSTHIASHVAQNNCRLTEDVGHHDQGTPGTPLRTASLRPHTMEKGLGESL